MTRGQALSVLAALGLALGCGGSATQPSAPPPSGPSSDGESDRPAGYQQGYPQQPGYGQQPATGGGDGQFAEPPTTEPLGPDLTQALEEFELSASMLQSAGSDCAGACKALNSMRRSSDRICELNGADDPGRRCERARERVDEAKKRVENSCSCPAS